MPGKEHQDPLRGRQGTNRVIPGNQGQPPRYPAPVPPRPRHGAEYAEPAADRYDDGYPAMERAVYTRFRDLASEGALGARLGTRQLPAHDVRNKLDRIYLSELLEEQGPPGPACFGPRIMKQAPVPNFQLPRGAKIGRASCRERVCQYV